MKFNVNLDTTSEYICNASLWPQPSCDVMVNSLDIDSVAHAIFETAPWSAYIDIYAIIDPERKIVTEFKLVCKKEDNTMEDTIIKVTSPADMVEYYKTFEYQGGDEFKSFIEESLQELESLKAEANGTIMDAIDDFLESEGARIPSSDKELVKDGEATWDEDGNVNSSVHLYGAAYDRLSEIMKDTLGTSDKAILRQRLDLLLAWSSEYHPDELDFYMELKEIGATLDDVERAWGSEQRMHTENFWFEHGIA